MRYECGDEATYTFSIIDISKWTVETDRKRERYAPPSKGGESHAHPDRIFGREICGRNAIKKIREREANRFYEKSDVGKTG